MARTPEKWPGAACRSVRTAHVTAFHHYFWVLLRPERPGARDRQGLLRLGNYALLVVDQHGLDGGGAYIDAEKYLCHADPPLAPVPGPPY